MKAPAARTHIYIGRLFKRYRRRRRRAGGGGGRWCAGGRRRKRETEMGTVTETKRRTPRKSGVRIYIYIQKRNLVSGGGVKARRVYTERGCVRSVVPADQGGGVVLKRFTARECVCVNVPLLCRRFWRIGCIYLHGLFASMDKKMRATRFVCPHVSGTGPLLCSGRGPSIVSWFFRNTNMLKYPLEKNIVHCNRPVENKSIPARNAKLVTLPIARYCEAY